MRALGVGVLTGWGLGVSSLPDDARLAAGRRRMVELAPPAHDGERFRRATRECLLAVAAVDAALRDAGLSRETVAGARTALVYVTAAAYGASNRNFIEAGRAGTYFPYTAPSAVPAEVAIEYGLTGGYVILVGGAAATVDALWQAGTLLMTGRCDRALVVAVETFAECGDLWARGRWATPQPLVEAAACAVLGPDAASLDYGSDGDEASPLETLTTRRAGETLACGPLVALALAREGDGARARLAGTWRGRRAAVTLSVGRQAVCA
jgi:3-oxoacyl-[acyl-carrier-protein] synthase III